jgi:hypothetical protein
MNATPGPNTLAYDAVRRIAQMRVTEDNLNTSFILLDREKARFISTLSILLEVERLPLHVEFRLD